MGFKNLCPSAQRGCSTIVPQTLQQYKCISVLTLFGGFSFFFLTGCNFSFSWFRFILRNCSWILEFHIKLVLSLFLWLLKKPKAMRDISIIGRVIQLIPRNVKWPSLFPSDFLFMYLINTRKLSSARGQQKRRRLIEEVKCFYNIITLFKQIKTTEIINNWSTWHSCPCSASSTHQ